MIAAILRWLPLSLALHAAALAATLLLPRDSVLPPLFVDLTLVEPITPPERPSGARDAAAQPRRQPATADGRRGASPPARTAVSSPPSPAPAAVSSPVAIAPAPSVAQPPDPPAVPPSTAMTPEPAPAVESHAVVPVTPPPAPPPAFSSTQTGPAAGEAVSAGAGSVSSVPRGGGDSAGTATGLVGFGGQGGGTAAGSNGGAGETLALGITGDDGGVYAGYIALLRRRVQEALTYPSPARRRGISGTVHLDISVEPTGRIADVLVVRSSSHDLLDAAALDAVRALRQVPFPPGVRPRAVRVRLPVVFELR